MESIKATKKILILPSWYPTFANPIVGSFFKEQAELVQDEYDIKILFGIQDYIGYKRFYYNNILNYLKQEKNNFIEQISLPLTPPEAISFKYSHIESFSEERNYNIMLTAYDDEFKKLIANDWKPDLIHAQCTVHAGIIASFLSEKYNIPAVITEHQVFLLQNYSKFIRTQIFKSLESVNKVAAVSYHQMRCILMNGINCNPVVIGNFINENIFSLKERKRGNVFKILSITYPHPIKDSETFFKAIAFMIAKGHTDISVTIIGNNSFHNLADANVIEFTKMAEKYEISTCCDFISYVDRANLPNQYYNHDVFVSTSIAETFGVAICEAISSGMPVVTTNSGGVDDTVNILNGIKVNLKDYEGIAEALIKIKSNEINFNAHKARESIVNKFGSTAFKRRLRNFYKLENTIHGSFEFDQKNDKCN